MFEKNSNIDACRANIVARRMMLENIKILELMNKKNFTLY
jgi:hypothetical protein